MYCRSHMAAVHEHNLYFCTMYMNCVSPSTGMLMLPVLVMLTHLLEARVNLKPFKLVQVILCQGILVWPYRTVVSRTLLMLTGRPPAVIPSVCTHSFSLSTSSADAAGRRLCAEQSSMQLRCACLCLLRLIPCCAQFANRLQAISSRFILNF